MYDVMKWIGAAIIWISIISVIVFGGLEIAALVGDLAGNTVEVVEGMEPIRQDWGEIVRPHLEKISWIGADLAILFLAYKNGKEYFDGVETVKGKPKVFKGE